ncbi:polyprenyl synthetase family protein [Amycolatopsis alba]|uniref:Polyprenyl synthetase family protein n=1 Tax=Amycolatopsis alba DSM 44262 TaxID=1125972 RepID=A0A229S8J8_AMYAL|nr:polyprenyl synthetase family protein [Amycolatopsis alba DSM 44262]
MLEIVNTTTIVTELGLDPADERHTEFSAALRTGLSLVEERLQEVLRSPGYPDLTEAATHLVRAGGKRLRPLMALAAAAFGDGRDDAISAAVLVELVHVATLYHDDVMDEAPMRHGVTSANSLWGNKKAVLIGDYVLACAARVGAGLGDYALRSQAKTFGRLVRGQFLETTGPFEDCGRHAPYEHHIQVMADKSASLIAMAGRLGAQVSGADERTIETLGQYGELIGVAFQISDDVLDISASTADLGKSAGTDLREGIVTLPMLHALDDDGPDAARLREIIGHGPVSDPALRREALGLLRDSAGVVRALAEAHGYAAKARDLALSLPDRPARALLIGLSAFVVDRGE